MEPVYYTVNTINGDYAYMTSDSGVENQVAMFLLPDGTDVGSRLLWENFEWTLVRNREIFHGSRTTLLRFQAFI